MLLFLHMSCLLHKQELYNQSNANKETNKYFYNNEVHLFSALSLFWFPWYPEQVFILGMYLQGFIQALFATTVFQFRFEFKMDLAVGGALSYG